jgi:peptidoglycan/xylan/chitin deacetylase (PgdA/CDA1 family)
MLDILRHTPATCPKTVALTFDDGPSPYTMQVLEILDLHGAYATFFVTGAHVAGRPEVARAIVAAGHAVGNHTYTHPQDVPGSQPSQRSESPRSGATQWRPWTGSCTTTRRMGTSSPIR